jgi:type IV pilus biogenesis protein CpaD/CtpE
MVALHIGPAIGWRGLALAGACAIALAGCAVKEPPLSAAPQPCPPWVDYPVDNHSNRNSPYLGCSNDLNLLRMVERPTDLDQGRPLGPVNAGRQADAVKNYDKDQVKPFVDGSVRPSQSGASVTGGSGGSQQ